MPAPPSPPATAARSAAPRDEALPSPFAWRGAHIGAEVRGARLLFTTRRGGISEDPFASLNLSATVGDAPALVAANRERVAGAVGLPWGRFCRGRQVHGARVRRALEPPAGAEPQAEEDGQATALQHAAALVLVADCLPVLLVADGAVAALHGGWRGLAAGILAEGVAALRDCGARGEVVAAIGPGARGCCYEVGEEVHARFPEPGARRGERGLELAQVARARLLAAGVRDIHDVGLCTMCSPGLFFSHRRDGGLTGRQAGIAWRAA